MKYRDLRDFVDQLEKLGQLRKTAEPVSPKLEMTAIGDKLLRAGGPAVLFTRPSGYKVPCLINLFGTPERVALGMGAASPADVESFRRAGRSAGIAFQLVDDLLDLTSDSVQMGKPVGADAQNNKLTYAGLFGVPAAQARVAALTAEAVGLLQGTRGDTAFLVELVRRMAARRN